MTHSPPDEKILERIKKLHAKAVSAKEIGSEAEALIFMDAVQKMLHKYDLEMSEVDYQLSLTQDPVKVTQVDSLSYNKKRASTQDVIQRLLAAAICRLFNCVFIGNDGSDRRGFYIVGRREHREVAHFVSTTLLRLMEDLSYKNYVAYFYECRRQGDVTRARGYKESWRQGFATAIASRVQAILVEREVAARGHGVALVRMNTEKKLIDDFMKRMEQAGMVEESRSKAVGRTVYNGQGLRDGKAEGDKANLSGAAVKGNSSSNKRLGSGNG